MKYTPLCSITVDFTEFGTGGGANVEDLATYQADSQTEDGGQGYTNGTTATSAACNRTWRQATIMAAVLANFISQTLGQSVHDTGSAPIWPTILSQLQQCVRQRCQANLNVFVSPSGNDSTGDGTSGNPWLTIEHAYNVISTQYDGNGFNATIKCANGTYGAGGSGNGLLSTVPPVGFSLVTIKGTNGSSNVTVAITNGNGFIAEGNTILQLTGVTITASGSGFNGTAISAINGGQIQIGTDVKIGACGTSQITAQTTGFINILDSYTTQGNAPAHIIASGAGANIFYSAGVVVTLTGTPVFATAFAYASGNSHIDASNATFSGSAGATTPRYNVNVNASIFTAGGGANFFPGTTAGSSSSGGTYA